MICSLRSLLMFTADETLRLRTDLESWWNDMSLDPDDDEEVCRPHTDMLIFRMLHLILDPDTKPCSPVYITNISCRYVDPPCPCRPREWSMPMLYKQPLPQLEPYAICCTKSCHRLSPLIFTGQDTSIWYSSPRLYLCTAQIGRVIVKAGE